jgi:hypothetical protein
MRGDEVIDDGDRRQRQPHRGRRPRGSVEVPPEPRRSTSPARRSAGPRRRALARLDGRGRDHPQQSWIDYASLAFGVTTLHDPSNDTSEIFTHSEMQRAGAVVGPRIFSTGTILYGAKAPSPRGRQPRRRAART